MRSGRGNRRGSKVRSMGGEMEREGQREPLAAKCNVVALIEAEILIA